MRGHHIYHPQAVDQEPALGPLRRNVEDFAVVFGEVLEVSIGLYFAHGLPLFGEVIGAPVLGD